MNAVVLLSGGLDSATCLYWARSKGYDISALTVHYGQRHLRELRSAKFLARSIRAKHYFLELPLPWLNSSSLVDPAKDLPDIPLSRIGKDGIPSTYVPGRNTVFLALGLSLADAIGAGSIILGANVLDYSGYPDCRPEFYKAFERMAALGTRMGVEGRLLRIETPLIHMDKANIVRLAMRLQVPIQRTWSCYRGKTRPCGSCDSCKLRAKGFATVGMKDPLLAL